ncbi:MAG: sigma-70 family RNA polymerase sigma factor [Planctomycetota bacterium]
MATSSDPTAALDAGRGTDLELVLEHSDWLRRLARSLVGDSALASDLSAAAIDRLKGRRDVRDQRAFLRRAVERLAQRHRRGEARRRARERHAATERQVTAPAAVDLAGELEAQRLLLDAVAALRPASREILFLRYYRGLSAAEIARHAGIAPAAARKRHQRALEELRAHLEHTWPSGSTWFAALAPLALASRPEPALAVSTFAKVAVVLGIVGLALLGTLLGRGGGRPAPLANQDLAAGDTIEPLARDTGSDELTSVSSPDSERSVVAAATDGRSRTSLHSIQLVGPGGGALAQRTVLLVAADRAAESFVSDASGRVTLPADGRTGWLLVARDGAFPFVDPVELVEVEREIRVPAALALAGRVAVDGRAPADPLELVIDSDQVFHPSQLVRDAAEEHFGPLRTRETSPSGSFSFGGLSDDWRGSIELPRGLRRPTTGFLLFGRDRVRFDAPNAGVVLDLVADPVATIRVVESDGESPVPRAYGMVFLTWREDDVSGAYTIRADDEGAVHIPLVDRRPDRFDIEIAREDGSAPTEHSVSLSRLESSLDLGTLPLAETRDVAFRAIDGAGAPIPGAIAFLPDGPESEPAGADGRGLLAGVPVTTTRFEALAPGFGRVAADVPAIASKTVDVVLKPTNRLLVQVLSPGGEPEARARLIVRARAGDGAWIDDVQALGDALPGRVVHGTGDDDGGTLWALALDSEGRAELQGLPSSDGVFLTVEDRIGATVHEAELPALVPGERRTHEIRLDVPLRNLTIRVVDGAGGPIAGAEVSYGRPGGQVSWMYRTDEDGRHPIRGHSLDVLDLRVGRNGYATRFVTVDALRETVEIELEPGISATVELVDAGGESIEDPDSVHARGDDAVEEWNAHRTPEGRWRFEGLPARALRLEVVRRGVVSSMPFDPREGTRTFVIDEGG